MAQPTAAGARDRRGEWRPDKPIRTPPLVVWPPRPRALLRWLLGWPGYLFPWNATFIAIAVLTWMFLTPDLATMRTLEPGWIALVWLRNIALMVVIYSAWHLRLYVQRAQGLRFKYNDKWLATGSKTFLFGDQLRDNLFWSVFSGGFFWSAYEVLTLWAYANGWLPYVDWQTNPVWFVLLLCLVPLLREVHFYLVHRLIHYQPLYRACHYLHHKNVNIGPWSGLAMHPLEHFLYFTGVLLHWVIPSHPIHAIFHLQHAALTPANGHAGFDEVMVGEGRSLPNYNFFHYLHHKYFTVNYGGDGAVPLDQWFGTFHDGTPAADAKMRIRQRATRGPGQVAGPAT